MISMKELLKRMGTKLYSNTDGKWHDVDTFPKSNDTKSLALVGGKTTFDNGYPQTTYPQTFTSYASKCKEDHGGTKLIWSHNGVSYFAAEKNHIEPQGLDTLLVNLCGSAINEAPKEPSSPVKKLPARLQNSGLGSFELAIQANPVCFGEEMMVEWPDMQTPKLKAKFWIELISQIELAGYKRVVFCCYGGHGRTGTALSAIRMAQGLNKNTDDAINWVRKHHCESAVESKAQIAYLDELAFEWYKWQPKTEDSVKPSK